MSEPSIIDGLPHQAIARQQARAMPDSDARSVRSFELCNSQCIRHRVSDWLFYEDVLARSGGKLREFKMPLVRKREHHGINVLVSQSRGQVASWYSELFPEGGKPA
jgi:hypothetical protein